MRDEKLWPLLENLEEGYYEVDLKGNYHFCNEGYAKILGVPKEEIIGLNYKTFLGETADTTYRIFHTVYSTGMPAKAADRKVTRPDGSERDIEYSVSLIKDEKGLPIGFRGIVRDVTEKKQIEETLRQSEERHRTILENIEDGYHEVDLKGNFTFFNESFRKIMGYTKEELQGMNYKQYTDPENAPKVLAAYNQVYRTGEPLKRFELEIIRKDGGRRNMVVSVSLINGVSNQLVGFRGIVRDETDWKEALNALRESEERYRTIFEQSNDGIALVKGDHHIHVNQKMAEIFGYDHPEDIIGRPVSAMVHPDDQERVKDINRRRQKGEPVIRQYEFKGRRKRGESVFIEVSATKTVYHGEIFALVFLRDVTERKRAEEALQSSKKLLQRLASKLLTAQETERKRIALEVHDVLGSSLSAIKFKVEEVLQRIDQGTTMEISGHLATLIPIIRDTIEEARRIQADLRPSLLDDLGIIPTLSWFCRRFETIYSDIRIEPVIPIQEDEVPDSLKIVIFRITQEALNNIGKHTKANLVHLGLRKINETIELTIRDNGEGFDQELILSREDSNNGMGLSSMKERTELMGGSFSIESQLGKGTVIKATWPV